MKLSVAQNSCAGTSGPSIFGRPPSTCRQIPILAFATQGAGGDDEYRLRQLLEGLPATFFPFDQSAKCRNFVEILSIARERKYRLLFMEGSGLAGGAALILSHLLYGSEYIFSSGDAVGPFLTSKWPWLKPIFHLYERALYRNSTGFVGWTPYLTGRALTMGAKRAASAAGWAPYPADAARRTAGRARIRKQLGIPDQAVVFGIAGSLAWSRRFQYCYGHELVRAAVQARSHSLRVLIVGDGPGITHLREMAGNEAGRTILFSGRISRTEVPDYLAAMDVGSLPQSVDGVGSFRYTTKVSEYLAARLPIVTNQIPLSYDLPIGGLWRLPGRNPWDPIFTDALADMMRRLRMSDVLAMRSLLPSSLPEFDRNLQVRRITEFLTDLTSPH